MDLLSILIHCPDILYTIPYKADFIIAQISHVVPGPWASCLNYLKFQLSHNIHNFFFRRKVEKNLIQTRLCNNKEPLKG